MILRGRLKGQDAIVILSRRAEGRLQWTKSNPQPTCQRTSTDVVVCGVTERMVGALSGAKNHFFHKRMFVSEPRSREGDSVRWGACVDMSILCWSLGEQLTVLQRGDGLAVLTVLAVANVIGGFYPKLVRREGL